MKLLKLFLFTLTICVCLQLNAQSNDQPKWLNTQFSKKVSLQTALIEINNKPSTYEDLLKIPDSSILKVEVYAKKQAQQFVDKNEAKNGLVLVMLHKKHLPYFPAHYDSTVYIVENNDTIVCKHIQNANINGDTTNASWIKFLQHTLQADIPAQNSAPAGVYNVEMMFLVNKDGSVSEVTIPEDPGYGTAAEVKRLMAISPEWDPAQCDDTKIIFRQREKVTFVVTEE